MLDLQWNDPYGGVGKDEFVLVPKGTAAAERAKAAAEPGSEVKPAKHTVTAEPGEKELHIYSSLDVSGKKDLSRSVYYKAK